MGDNKNNNVPVTPAIQSDNAILLYNSQNIAPEQLQAQFSIRLKEYGRVWQDIKKSKMTHPEQHYLIQGVRGAGKTMFLTKLAQDVSLNESLKDWLIPILLNEEEYSIFSLFTFWLRVAQILSSSHTDFSALYEQINTLDEVHEGTEDIQLAELSWQHIREALQKHGKKIIILMDNMAELFDSFSDTEHAQLREVLSLHAEVRIIGGSSVILDSHFDTLAPFYQFFKMVNLKSISQEEMHTLLKTLAKQVGKDAEEKINTLIAEHPERIEAVRRLTDGVPRTITLLFQIIMEGAKSSSYAYLEETIDKTTPLYKHRMDDLSRQQKPIVHAIAMSWDAVSAREIAEATRLPSKTVSAQISQLQKQWIIEKIPTNTKNHLYAIKERFFNIWYLMRYGDAKDKQRVMWLTRFLESWCDERELESRLQEILEGGSTEGLNFDYINALLSSEKISLNKRKKAYEVLQKKCNAKSLVLVESLNTGDSYIEQFKESLEQGKSNAIEFIYNQIESQNIDGLIFFGYFLKKEFKTFNEIFNSSFESNFYEVFFKKAEDIIIAQKDEKQLFYLISIYLSEAIKKDHCLEWALTEKEHVGLESLAISILIWNDEFEKTMNRLNECIKNIYSFNYSNEEVRSKTVTQILFMLLAKKQVETTYRLIKDNTLEEKLKPMYYATLSLLSDERNQEYLRMGAELKPTVNEILEKVEEYKVKYA